jgi:hypothetical protein
MLCEWCGDEINTCFGGKFCRRECYFAHYMRPEMKTTLDGRLVRLDQDLRHAENTLRRVRQTTQLLAEAVNILDRTVAKRLDWCPSCHHRLDL